MEHETINPNDFDESKLNDPDFQSCAKRFSIEFAKFNSMTGLFGDIELFFNCVENYASQLSADKQIDLYEGLRQNELYCYTKYSRANQYKGSESFNLDEHNTKIAFYNLMLDRLYKLNNTNQVNSIDIEPPLDNGLSEFELRTQKDQIRLLYDLGVLKYLRDKYPNSLKSNNQLAELIGKVLKLGQTSIVPTINALMNENFSDKNYASKTPRTSAIIEVLNAKEKI